MSKKIFVTLCLFSVLVAATATATAEGFEEEEGLLILNDDNFYNATAKFPYLLIRFYSEHCKVCKEFAPEFEKAAKLMKETMPNIRLAKFNATDDTPITFDINLDDYTHLKFFLNDQLPLTFTGERKAEVIADWVKNTTAPRPVYIEVNCDLDKIISDNEVVAVYFGDNPAEQTTFDFLVLVEEDTVFAYANATALREAYNVSDNVKIVLFTNFEKGRTDYTGPFACKNISDFLRQNEFPTVVPFNEKSYRKLFKSENVGIFLFTKSNENDPAVAALNEASATLKGKILISVANLSNEYSQSLLSYIKFNEADLPCIFILKPDYGGVMRYLYTGEITAQGIVSFYEQFAKNELKTWYKSQPLPESNDQPVKVVVRHNYDQVVNDDSKDVFVMYYGLCENCDTLAPLYKKVAEQVQHISNITFAKCDPRENEIDGVRLKELPNIIFYPAGNKTQPVLYQGEKTTAGILEFVKKQTTFDWVESTGEKKKEEL